MFTRKDIGQYGRHLAVAAGITLLGMGALPQAKAGQSDETVRMTFSGPVQIPGKVLPAGTYVFRRWSMFGNPNAMMVMNADDQRVVGMTMYLPTYENAAPPEWSAGGGDARANVHVSFDEAGANTPQLLRSWNYPGDPTGFKLVYPEGAH